MSLESNNSENPQLFSFLGVIITSLIFLGTYLLTEKFIFGRELTDRVIFIGGVGSITIMIAMFFIYRKRQKNNKK